MIFLITSFREQSVIVVAVRCVLFTGWYGCCDDGPIWNSWNVCNVDVVEVGEIVVVLNRFCKRVSCSACDFKLSIRVQRVSTIPGICNARIANFRRTLSGRRCCDSGADEWRGVHIRILIELIDDIIEVKRCGWLVV